MSLLYISFNVSYKIAPLWGEKTTVGHNRV